LKRFGQELGEPSGLLSRISSPQLSSLDVLAEGSGCTFKVAADGVGLRVFGEPFAVGLEALDL
jgi:hypothetical protein